MATEEGEVLRVPGSSTVQMKKKEEAGEDKYEAMELPSTGRGVSRSYCSAEERTNEAEEEEEEEEEQERMNGTAETSGTG